MKQNLTLLFLLLILLIFFNCSNVRAQMIIIEGQVKDKVSANCIYGATVTINTIYKVNTDLFGRFDLKIVAQDSITIQVNYLGYTTYTLTISKQNVKSVLILMQQSNIDLKEVSIVTSNSNYNSQLITGIDKLLCPINNSQELLQLVPGLFVAQHAGGGKAEQLFLRGFDCDHGTDFNITVDGLPVNMVSHVHGQGYADFHFVIPEVIDRLNVYKGPYNARFGDFATSGTGEFFTKNTLSCNSIKLEAGMYDTYRAAGMFNLLDKKHLSSKGTENAYVAAEYVYTNSYFQKKQDFNRVNLFAKYTGFINKYNQLSFSASTFFAGWDASGQVPQRAVESGLISRYGSIDPSEGGGANRSNINATLTTYVGNAVIKNQVYYVNYNFNLYSDFTFYLKDSVHGDAINQTDKRNIFGYCGSFIHDLTIKNVVVTNTIGAGIRNDFAHLSLKHVEHRELLDTISSGNLFQQNANAYYDIKFALKKLTINSGLRFDLFHFKYIDDKIINASGDKVLARVNPKLNFAYNYSDKIQMFLNTGIGFHSNDARSVVINKVNNSLPRAYGVDLGTELKPNPRLIIHSALWFLYLQSELIYIGDEATIETNSPTKRLGVDLSLRYQLSKNLFYDFDLNFSYARLVALPVGANYVPLAPTLTSTGGIIYKQKNGFNTSLRYRHINSRPANQNNSVTAKGYFLLDAVANYKFKKIEVGLSAENLCNTIWNQAQFDTESKLQTEIAPVSELHFTPGTPFFIKTIFTINF